MEIVIVHYDSLTEKLSSKEPYPEYVTRSLCDLAVKASTGYLISPSLMAFHGSVIIESKRIIAPVEFWYKLQEIQVYVLRANNLYKRKVGKGIWCPGHFKTLKLSI